MKGTLLLFLLLVTALATALYLLRNEGSSDGGTLAADEAAEASLRLEDGESAQLVEPAREAERSPQEGVDESPSTGAAAEVEVAEKAEDPEEEEHIRVRVLDAAGAATPEIPVGVFYSPPDAPRPMPVGLALTEADGVAHFRELAFGIDDIPLEIELSIGVDLPLDPRVEQALTQEELRAALGGDVLVLQLPPGAEKLGGPLRVQVLDAGGTPAIGVEVGYRLQQRGAPDKGDDIARAKTEAPDGIVELDRTKEAGIRSYFEGLRQPFERVVACRGALISPPARLLDDASLGTLVRLQLEPTGSLDVEVVGPDGERITEGAAVQFSWTRPGEERRDSFEWLKLEDGTAHVDHVACGMKIDLGASVRNSFYKGVGESVPGPAKLGERVSVTLRFEAKHPALTGRLLAPDGAPLADQRFSLQHDYSEPPEMRSGPFRWSGSFHATDAEGRFSLPWSMAGWEQVDRRGFRLLRFVESPPRSGAPDGWFPRFSELPAPRFAETETRYDVGDVTLRDMPLLVSGQVVDEEEQPLRSAYVQVQYAVKEGERVEWYNHQDRPRSDAEGRFELRSILPYERIRVSAWKTRGGSSDTIEVPVGTTDVRLVFIPDDPEESRGRLRGEILADEGIPWNGLEIRLRPAGPDARGGYRDTMPFAGAYSLQRVQPGSYRLEVVADGHGFDGPAFVFFFEEDIEVRAGEETSIPTIDLRGKLRLYELTVLDAEGERIHRVPCEVLNPRTRHRGGWVYDGRLAFIAPADLDSVEVAVGKHAPVAVRWTPEPQTITLR